MKCWLGWGRILAPGRINISFTCSKLSPYILYLVLPLKERVSGQSFSPQTFVKPFMLSIILGAWDTRNKITVLKEWKNIGINILSVTESKISSIRRLEWDKRRNTQIQNVLAFLFSDSSTDPLLLWPPMTNRALARDYQPVPSPTRESRLRSQIDMGSNFTSITQ